MTCLTAKRLSLAAAAALAFGTVATPAPAQAQMRAVLPTIDQVEPLEPLEIDGVWEIREIRERIVIGNGHAYADDGWVHLMLFRIEPGQVVIKNIRELANGDYVAQDLPAMAGVTFEWVGQDTLRGRTNGLIPIVYHLDRVTGSGGDYPVETPLPRPVEGDEIPLEEVPEEEGEYVSPW
ncbi:MAG: hypothetical protein SXU28_12745 [Pseudomonadota bacterium]|nr:hypothetical protein [Pseudomonadota bacterium]